MRWNNKKYKEGDTRLVERFAWVPTLISGTDTVVWLEKYQAVEMLVAEGHDDMFDFVSLEWTTVKTQLKDKE